MVVSHLLKCSPHYIEEKCLNLAQYLKVLGFDFSEENNGDIIVSGYKGYLDNEYSFFAEAAPFIEAGQILVWDCEDENYIWAFNGVEMQEFINKKDALDFLQAHLDKNNLEENIASKPSVVPLSADINIPFKL